MDKPPPRTYTLTKPRAKRGPYKNKSNSVFDDLGNRICRVCHDRVYRNATTPRRWPLYCSTKCNNWETYQRYLGSLWCKCGAIKEMSQHQCNNCKVNEAPLKALRRRLTQYGLTVEQATVMMDKQGWQCVCRVAIDWGTCHVDHDHACCSQHPNDSGYTKDTRACGKCVRGFLCSGCNVALGQANDDADRLRRLADYVELGGPKFFSLS